MQEFLRPMPQTLQIRFTEKYGDWQELIRTYSPLMTTAFDYAERTGIKVSYRNLDEDSSGPAAVAWATSRTIKLGYSDCDHPSDLSLLCHEIKHIKQGDDDPLGSAWQTMWERFDSNLNENEPISVMECHVVSPADYMLLNWGREIDAHAYKMLVMSESIQGGVNPITYDAAAEKRLPVDWTPEMWFKYFFEN